MSMGQFLIRFLNISTELCRSRYTVGIVLPTKMCFSLRYRPPPCDVTHWTSLDFSTNEMYCLKCCTLTMFLFYFVVPIYFLQLFFKIAVNYKFYSTNFEFILQKKSGCNLWYGPDPPLENHFSTVCERSYIIIFLF